MDLIDQVGRMPGREKGGATFEQHTEMTFCSENSQQFVRVVEPLSTRVHSGVRGHRTHHDAQRVGSGDMTHGQFWVIGPHGAGSDDDHIGFRSQTVHIRACLRAGNPLRCSVGGGRPPVECCGHLRNDIGASSAAMVKIRSEIVTHAGCVDTGNDLNASRAQRVDTRAVHSGIRIGDGDHHAGNSSGDDGVGARWCTAVMAAWFQCDDQRCAPGCLSGVGECGHLSMWTARLGGGPGAQHVAVFVDHHRSDAWVRSGQDSGVASEQSCHTHGIEHAGIGIGRSSIRLAACKGAAWEVGGWHGGVNTPRGRVTEGPVETAPIRTVTVGPGIPPDRPLRPKP